MVRNTGKWVLGEPTQAFLISLDISGFTKDVKTDRLFHLRHGFLHSVSKTRLLRSHSNSARAHFLGDELRIAFHVDVGVAAVRDFIIDLFNDLEQVNRTEPVEHQVRLRTVVLAGPVIWSHWHGCYFLDGQLPSKAQYWMNQLAPSEIAADHTFKTYLDVGGLSTNLTPREIRGEGAYILSTGQKSG